MTADHRQRKLRLMAFDPHCYWCGCEVFDTRPARGQVYPRTTATIDHLHDRIDYPDGRPSRGRIVLSCLGCNEDRANAKKNKQPLEFRWQESGAYPVGHPLHRDLTEIQELRRSRGQHR